MLADDHPLVDVGARADEKLAARLKVEERVRRRRALAVRHDCAVLSAKERSRIGVPAFEHGVEKPFASGLRHEEGAKSDQASRRYPKLDAYAVGADWVHLAHHATPVAEKLRHGPDMALRDVDYDDLDWLALLPVDFPNYDFGHP